jgi:hypothetical protein
MQYISYECALPRKKQEQGNIRYDLINTGTLSVDTGPTVYNAPRFNANVGIQSDVCSMAPGHSSYV